MASQGLVGLVFLVGFLGFVLYGVSRGRSDIKEIINRPLYLGSIYALIYTLIQTSVSGGLSSAPHLFWICAVIHCLARTMPTDASKKVCLVRQKQAATELTSYSK